MMLCMRPCSPQLALILAGSGGTKLDLGRQDAHGCTLMHYACGLRNAPALQLLLNSSVDPQLTDAHGHTAVQWARRFGFQEGEVLISRATGSPLVSTPPHQSVPTGDHGGLHGAPSSDSTGLPFAGVAAGGSLADGASCAPTNPTLLDSAPVASGLSGLPQSDLPLPPPPTRSLEQFLEPQVPSAGTAPAVGGATTGGDGMGSSAATNDQERSLAGLFTAAAAHVESTPGV